MTPSIQVSEDTLAFEILNRHCEYHDGLSRGQRFVGADNALAAVREALAMKAAEPLPEGDVDAVDEALRAFHYETFRAGVCYERDEWPLTEEEWKDLDRGIQSEAVGEHYEGWSTETIDKLRAALVRIPVDDGVERTVREQAEWCRDNGAEYVTGIRTADLLAAISVMKGTDNG